MIGAANLAHLLVYGTLQQGQRNHHLMAGARSLGHAETAEARFNLAVYGSVSTPGRVTPAVSPDGPWRIGGELFAVGPELLAELDRFERVGIDYDREAVPLALGGSAFIYLHRAQSRRLPLPDAPGRLIQGDCATWRDPMHGPAA